MKILFSNLLNMHHQISLFPLQDIETDFSADDWETPDDIASSMAALIKTSDRRVLEPAAGSGQIAQFLPPGSRACEIKPHRVALGRQKAPHCHWLQADFFSLNLESPPLSDIEQLSQGYDLIITNPPFSQCIQFLKLGLKLLNTNNPDARLLYLLPVDFCSSVERGQAWKALECHIHHEYRILNRVAYIRDGKAHKGRQIYDAVFDIRPGNQTGAISFLLT